MAFDWAERGLPRHLERRQRAERRRGLQRRPGAPLDAIVLELDGGHAEGQAAFLAAAGGLVEVGEAWLCHATRLTEPPTLVTTTPSKGKDSF